MTRARTSWTWAVLLAAAVALSGCKDGDPGPQGETGPQGPAGPTGPAGNSNPLKTQIGLAEDLPGVNLTILGLTGSGGAAFQVGDTISVTFKVEMDSGFPIPLEELDSVRMWMAGPTNRYQKVTGNFNDIATRSVQNPDGSWTYTFPSAIPATYPLQYNETGFFPENEGLSGQALLSGTYTVCFRAYKYYWDPKGERYRDVGNVTYDFLLGSATTIEPRVVVSDAMCNSCHGTLQMHGGSYRSVNLCITCHTVGAESSLRNALPGQKKEILDFGVMIHKLHNAVHLPSVLGVTVDAEGNKDYTSVPPQPYIIGGHVFSEEVHFPVFPKGMPRDRGYDDLSSAAEDQEDEILEGITACAKCHVDPDGNSGPLTLADNNAFKNPTRRACGSCHDDIKWDQMYISNSGGMGPQADDSKCLDCHAGSGPGDALGTQQAHIHPIHDSALNTGVVFAVTSVGEDPNDANANEDGDIDVGEKVRVTITIKDDFGNNVAPAAIGRWEVLVGGPTENPQLFQRKYMPTDLLGPVASSYTFNVPEFWTLNYVGSYGEVGGTFPEQTIRAPFYTENTTNWAPNIEVYEVTEMAEESALAAATRVGQNYLDVVDGSKFKDEGYIVVDPGGDNEQYYRIYAIDSSMPNRLQFGRLDSGSSSRDFGSSDLRYAPWVRTALPAGTIVAPVTVELKTLDTDYTVDEADGQISTMGEGWGEDNPILISAVTDFVLPTHYRNGYTRETNQDGSEGSWIGLEMLDGTYGVSVGGSVTFSVVPPRTLGTGDDGTGYNGPSLLASGSFRVGSAGTVEKYPPVLLSSADNCDDCHGVPGETMVFHGRRAGAEYCYACHGTARFGSGSPVAGRRTMRQMIHGFHMGKDLTFASTYENGAAEHIAFPMMPGGTKHCDKCHGNSSYEQPVERDHPDQIVHYKKYATACLSCHDSTGARAHADLMTAISGYESCVACHGTGSINNVEISHKNR